MTEEDVGEPLRRRTSSIDLECISCAHRVRALFSFFLCSCEDLVSFERGRVSHLGYQPFFHLVPRMTQLTDDCSQTGLRSHESSPSSKQPHLLDARGQRGVSPPLSLCWIVHTIIWRYSHHYYRIRPLHLRFTGDRFILFR